MPDSTLFIKVKLALRKTTTDFDTEIQDLISDCLAELTMLGIYRDALEDDPQIESAVIYYCKANFGANDDGEKWLTRYREKVTKLLIASGYGGPENGPVG